MKRNVSINSLALLLSITIFICSSVSASQEYKAVLTAGKGLPGITIKKTDLKEAIAILGPIQQEKKSSISASFYYFRNGLMVNADSPERGGRINTIIAEKGFQGKTEMGIGIGDSEEVVIKAYGETKVFKPDIISYDKDGISFKFDHNAKVSSIVVMPPRVPIVPLPSSVPKIDTDIKNDRITRPPRKTVDCILVRNWGTEEFGLNVVASVERLSDEDQSELIGVLLSNNMEAAFDAAVIMGRAGDKYSGKLRDLVSTSKNNLIRYFAHFALEAREAGGDYDSTRDPRRFLNRNIPSTPKPGLIEGAFIEPEDAGNGNRICADNILTLERYCTATKISSDSGPRYSLTVPPGDYVVFSELNYDMSIWIVDWNFSLSRSYFTTDAVPEEYSLHSTPAVVKIQSGETRSNVNPMDFYYTRAGNGIVCEDEIKK